MLRGIKHGHFSYHIEGGGNKNGQRNITLNAGLAHRYQINLDELPSNLTPLATFYPLAQYEPSATLETSAEDAQVDTEKPHEKGTDAQ